MCWLALADSRGWVIGTGRTITRVSRSPTWPTTHQSVSSVFLRRTELSRVVTSAVFPPSLPPRCCQVQTSARSGPSTPVAPAVMVPHFSCNRRLHDAKHCCKADRARHRVKIQFWWWLGIHQPLLTQRNMMAGETVDSAEGVMMSEVCRVPNPPPPKLPSTEKLSSPLRLGPTVVCKALPERNILVDLRATLGAGPVFLQSASRHTRRPPWWLTRGNMWNEVSLLPQIVRPCLPCPPLHTFDRGGASSGMEWLRRPQSGVFVSDPVCLGLLRRFGQNHSRRWECPRSPGKPHLKKKNIHTPWSRCNSSTAQLQR